MSTFKFLVADSEEEESEALDSDEVSYQSSGDSAPKSRRRRTATQHVIYRDIAESSSDEDKGRRPGKTGVGRGKVMSDSGSSPDLGSDYEEEDSEPDTGRGGRPAGRGVGHKKIFDDSDEDTKKSATKGRGRTKAKISSTDEEDVDNEGEGEEEPGIAQKTIMKTVMSEDDEFTGLGKTEDTPESTKNETQKPPHSKETSLPVSPKRMEENRISGHKVLDANGKMNGHPHSIDALLKSSTTNGNNSVEKQAGGDLRELERGEVDLLKFVTE